MDLKRLRYFAQVARLGSFNRAAGQLYVAQSALSRQVRLLEDEVGVTLLTRHARGVQLTHAGELMLERAEALLRSARQLQDDVAAAGTQPRGELVIGMPPSLQNLLALPLLERMTADYPQLSMTTWVGTSMVLRDLVISGSVDLAVLGTFGAETTVTTDPLLRDPFYLVGARCTLDQRSISIRRAATLPLVLTSRPNSVRLLVENKAAKFGVELNVAMEVNYLPLILDLVEKGTAFSALPYHAVKRLVAEGRIAAARIENLAIDWEIAVSKDRPLSAGARCAQRVLRELAHPVESNRVVGEIGIRSQANDDR